MTATTIARPASRNGVTLTPAEEFIEIAYRWHDSASLQRRTFIGGMDKYEAQDLLLLVASIVPAVFYRAAETERRTRA